MDCKFTVYFALLFSCQLFATDQLEKPEEKIVLVTGASGEIGKSIATELLHAGYHVIAHYNKSIDIVSNILPPLCDLRVES